VIGLRRYQLGGVYTERVRRTRDLIIFVFYTHAKSTLTIRQMTCLRSASPFLWFVKIVRCNHVPAVCSVSIIRQYDNIYIYIYVCVYRTSNDKSILRFLYFFFQPTGSGYTVISYRNRFANYCFRIYYARHARI